MSDEARRLGRRALFGRLLPRLPAERRDPWVKAQRTAMGCRFEVTLPSEDVGHTAAARAALDEVEALEAQLSEVRADSELSRVNRRAAEAPVPLSPGLFALFSLCQELVRATGGAFDPAAGPVSGWDEVALDGLGRTVRFAGPGVEVRLEPVGRGWALDRVAASLRVRRVERALLSAGASRHRGWGSREWEVALRAGGEELGLLRLHDAAAATRVAGEGTGCRPAEGVRSASVVTTEATAAEALATAFLVAGPDLAASFCAARRGTVAFLVLDASPREIRLYGRRDGVAVDTAAGVRLVEAGE